MMLAAVVPLADLVSVTESVLLRELVLLIDLATLGQTESGSLRASDRIVGKGMSGLECYGSRHMSARSREVT